MSIFNTNSLNTIEVSNNLANETNLNDITKICENRELNESSKSKQPTTTATAAATIATTVTTTVTVATMPAATNPTSATVTVLNSSAQFPSISSDQCSDSEEDFDRTTKNLGAHKWIFNYKDVSSLNPKVYISCSGKTQAYENTHTYAHIENDQVTQL